MRRTAALSAAIIQGRFRINGLRRFPAEGGREACGALTRTRQFEAGPADGSSGTAGRNGARDFGAAS